MSDLWEVFVRPRRGLAHVHVGSIHAADAAMALRNARDVYTRRQEGVSLWVVPAAEVYTQAHAWAAKLAQGPALALRAAKESIDTGLETDIETGLAVERNWFAGLFATEDRERGMRSFVEEGPGKAKFL